MHAPLSQVFRVEWRTLVSLASLAGEWRELASRAIEPNVFYEPAFALAAQPVFGADTRAVLVRNALGKLVGLFPGHASGIILANTSGGCPGCSSAHAFSFGSTSGKGPAAI